MHHFKARNVHQMLPIALHQMALRGFASDSRNGPVLQLVGPTVLEYTHPEERVMFHPERDANPFFHLMECLWMMAGRNDVKFPAHFVSTMKDFSDDGKVFNGAYGHRWRVHFGRDQLPLIVEGLRADPTCRRQVLTMWDGAHDLGLKSKDLPCNLQAIFQVEPVSGKLNMTVTNRSNDLVWGATGANAVHFSFLHEFIARAAGLQTGTYYQVSANMHLYTEKHTALMEADLDWDNPYRKEGLKTVPIISVDPKEWFEDLLMFLDEGVVVGLRDRFFRRVAVPVYQSFQAYKQKGDPERFEKAIEIVQQCADDAWATACWEWLLRRKEKADARK